MLCIYLRAGDGMGLSRDLWEAPRKASWALDLNRRLGLGWEGRRAFQEEDCKIRGVEAGGSDWILDLNSTSDPELHGLEQEPHLSGPECPHGPHEEPQEDMREGWSTLQAQVCCFHDDRCPGISPLS